jgi:hypothetical protein
MAIAYASTAEFPCYSDTQAEAACLPSRFVVNSRDGRRRSDARRDAIEAFWTAYLQRQGANVEWAIDGPGRLPQFVADFRDNPTRSGPPRMFARLIPDLRRL